MKLTKNWLPLLGIYTTVGFMAGVILSYGGATCTKTNNSWIVVGLIIAIAVWCLHMATSKEDKRRKK